MDSSYCVSKCSDKDSEAGVAFVRTAVFGRNSCPRPGVWNHRCHMLASGHGRLTTCQAVKLSDAFLFGSSPQKACSTSLSAFVARRRCGMACIRHRSDETHAWISQPFAWRRFSDLYSWRVSRRFRCAERVSTMLLQVLDYASVLYGFRGQGLVRTVTA